MLGIDGSFEVDDYGENRIISEGEMIRNIVLYILMSKPGQYPSLPTIGMDIKSILMEQFDSINLETLQQRMIDQCAALDVYLSKGDIQFQKGLYHNNPAILIYIDIPNDTAIGKSVESTNEYRIGISIDRNKDVIFNINATNPSHSTIA